MDGAPLVLTLALARQDQERFDRLRRQHFPSERLHVGAHVTLFHALPGPRVDDVLAACEEHAPPAPLPVAVTGVRMLGRGVAYQLASPVLSALHAALLAAFTATFGEDVLTRQDRARLSAHVTVQNKVDPERARALHAALSAAFTPSEVTATGLALWRYVGGPWEAVTTVPFGSAPR
ncbi:2'-5' RNA ligase family protein [Quadrisphaera sp. DSM 44207]|uniref:2'-5' RNA ligase family protein n=1 Tax=Quadrisphaera sp. DSM 44207 TaxID=1881057 RepID=UPI001C40A8E6|nr:2'-5' RNA ligase family protein [Quadrisphaera sp. DSM 44207]